jgi:hypothetical protein
VVLGQVILVDTPYFPFSNSTYESTYVAQMLNLLTPFSFTQITAIQRNAPILSNAHYHLGAFYSNPCKIPNSLIIYMLLISIQSVCMFFWGTLYILCRI